MLKNKTYGILLIFIVLSFSVLIKSEHFIYEYESPRIIYGTCAIFLLGLFAIINIDKPHNLNLSQFILSLLLIFLFLTQIPQRNNYFLIGTGSGLISFFLITSIYIKNNERVMIFIGLGSIQVLICLFQYIGVLSSGNAYFAITGSFDNPNTTALLFLCCLPHSIYYYFRSKKKVVLFYVCMVFACLLILNSRSVFFAVLMFLAIYIFKKHKKYTLPLVLFIGLSCIFLFLLKKDSALGRMYIWEVSIKSFDDDIFFGKGTNGFSINYMLNQAEYMRTHVNDKFKMLAGDIGTPYNQYLFWLINYGLIFMLLITIWFINYFRDFDFIYNPNKVLIFFIMISAMFYYPFNYFFIICILLLGLSANCNQKSSFIIM
ncbi:hypothetical protein HZY62_21165 [Maribacter polysiphoniae]|uniref:O-antigen ligase-related domain-containing protein n=1 Tax=Maribacter polysiphoniae TaxID=429344 RepID=A0A316DH54_9FLAO|nr:O-antigen ligase family protein [Maribacter polysiphoniae]MBD1263113.1 hypothetical protein [Maribacter polysiphoniae]PWK16996.1 hypothetical protein LX92_04480 [Maribacter polysiphoniae]